MPNPKRKKYVKYELSYKQKQKLLKLSGDDNIDPENIILIIEEFFDEWSENEHNINWETVLTYLNIKILDSRINSMSDEVIEIKKKNKIQEKMQVEYEDDYLALIELGKARIFDKTLGDNMKKKQIFNIHIPDEIAEKMSDLDSVVDKFMSNYRFLVNLELDDLTNEENLENDMNKLTEDFNIISQTYGKLRQEYGVLNFHGNELFTRNTLTGLKLGLVMGKLEKAKSIWGDQLSLDYDAAKDLIQYFFDRYLKKSDDD